MRRLFRHVLLAAIALPSAVFAGGVGQFSPQGQVDQQTRATVSFYSDMTKLGDVSAPAPFAVDCGAVKGSGRWVDARHWSWQLERALQAGERCDFRLKPGLKDLAGQSIYGQAEYAFFAPGPWPRSVRPYAGNAIEEDQAFVIDVSAPVKPASVESNVWCEAEGVGNRIPVKLFNTADRNAVLGAVSSNAGDNVLVVSCVDRLPPGAHVKLVWGKGVEASNGTRTSRAQEFRYTVQPVFSASFTCEREKANAPCSPLSGMTLNFSKAVDIKLARAARLKGAGEARAPQSDENESNQRPNTATQISFPGPFPQNAELTIELPKGLKDEAGRPLANAASYPLKVRTGTLPPLAKFPGAFGIVELTEGGLLPVTVRNVEAPLGLRQVRLDRQALRDQRLTDDGAVIATMRQLKHFENQTRNVTIGTGKDAHQYTDIYYARELPFIKRGSPGVEERTLPRPAGKSEFEVLGIPLQKPGFHVVEIESQLLGAALLSTPKPMYVRATALVTNLAVHLKTGRDNALVWVTTLDTGKPVANAEVRISNCDGQSLWQGKTDAQGRSQTAQPIKAEGRNQRLCNDGDFLFASARLGDDYSFVRSDWNEGIEPWRFGVDTWAPDQQRTYHTVLDRSLFRPGQTVSMKHLVRERSSSGFRVPDVKSLPNRLTIRHWETDTEFSQPLVWDANGSAVSQWKIPDNATRGQYSISLSGGGATNSTESGSFNVSDFRLPVFTGRIQGVPVRQVAPKSGDMTVPLSLGLSFLNGGAAKGAEVKVSSTVRPRWVNHKGYDGFNFDIGLSPEDRAAFKLEGERMEEYLVLDQQPLTLDKAGAGKLDVALTSPVNGPAELYSEMSFTDPNGEIQTIHGTVELSPAALSLGIKVRDWAAVRSSQGSSGDLQIVALDANGKPVSGSEVTLLGKRRIEYAHRRRVVGGFYTYEHHTEFEDLGRLCRGTTDARGIVTCTPSIDKAGDVLLLAEAEDSAGRKVQAATSYWVTGGGDLWFTAGNQDRIDVIPEKRIYAPGEKARFQVRTPFREATALVAVEAGGVIDSYVMPLSRFDPVVEIPVKGEWGPNVYVSVLAVRGRVQPLSWTSFFQWGWREPIAWFKEWWSPSQPTAMVDLAKPAYRLGLAEIGVGADAFKLNVDVTPDRKDYRPRDQAVVKIKVTAPDGKPLPVDAEVALAAVDQALLELKSNDTWELLDAMLQKRAYLVETSTAQGQVIGKRHFGRKAVPAGGGGGRGPARELFDTLLAWNPRVKLDANGYATLNVPINDSLTEFRIVAVATAGSGLFGTGSASIRTKQDLQMISGLPPLVREKDSYVGLLTLRNGTAKPMTVTVNAKVGDQALEKKDVKLEAEGAAEVSWTAKAPEGVDSLTWEFDAADTGSNAKDRLRITQQVAPAVPITVQQSSFVRVEGKYEIAATAPTGALPGKGGVEVGLSPRISALPPGVQRFFENYPYICLEQKTSISVGLHDAKRWQAVAEALPAYLDADGLARYFPGEGAYNEGSVALTAYVLDVTREAGFAIPDAARQKMEAGLTRFVEGRIKRERHLYRPAGEDLLAQQLLALEALTRAGRTPTAAAAALEVEPMRLPTSALIDWYLVVKRLPELPQRAARLAAADRELRNRLSYTGGRLNFTTERSDFWWWSMVSGDSNAFRLIDAVIDEPTWQADLPALVLGAVQRQARGRWLTTVANVWATLSLDKFGRKFEKEAVKGTTRAALAALAAAKQSYSWKGEPGEAPRLMLGWPEKVGADTKLAITHEGSGKPWANLQVLAALPVSEARNFGYRVSRSVAPIEEKTPGKVSRGDLWRVTLDVEAEQDMDWVVINDPIPAGARILGDGDGRDSSIGRRGETRSWNEVWPTFIERTFSGLRAYYAFVPRGHFHLDYTVRINNAGEFSLPATRVEAMYAPDVFGEAPNGKVVVGN